MSEVQARITEIASIERSLKVDVAHLDPLPTEWKWSGKAPKLQDFWALLDSFELIVEHDLFARDRIDFLGVAEVNVGPELDLEGHLLHRDWRTVV